MAHLVRVLAVQALGPEFGSIEPTQKAGCEHISNPSAGEGDKKIPGAC